MHSWRAGAAVLGVAVLVTAGCIITIEPVPGDGNGDNGGADTLRIRIVNATNVGLDPQIYISPESVTPEELFTVGTKFTSFGFLTLGVLDGFDQDTFRVSCADALVIGTMGGALGEDPLNNPDGSGRQIVLSQESSLVCGDTIVFTYSRSGGGFTTSVSIEP